ncbi:MAG: L,D-transpeptidase [Myxococcota bacterium]
MSALVLLSPGCEQATAAMPPSEPMAVETLDDATTRERPSTMNMTVDEMPESQGMATERSLSSLSRKGSTAASEPVSSTRPEPAATETVVAPVELAPIPAEREPIEARTARQRLTIRVAPDHRAPRRARIPMGESFDVFELVEGKSCGGKGWADVGNGGFVCLAETRKATRAPRTMPAIKGDGVMPFYFAAIPAGKTARRWSSLQSYLAGDEPQTVSAPGRHFAFKTRRAVKGTTLLVDKRGRVMPERDLRRFRPSSFAGHDLRAEPVPQGQRLAWATKWPETTVRVAADAEAEIHEVLDYHAEIYVEPTPVKTASGTFYELVDGGYVSSRHIRRWEPVTDLGDPTLAQGERWLDVDVDQQTLTVMEGDTPVYTTLISSGLKGPTPTGLFRINEKEAYGSMSSAPGASDVYAVEAVPYVQYFHGGIALHSAYWHDRFGHRASHGCINLSPRDAAYVYSLTGPHPREGWMEVYEDEGDLGTRVRVRDGLTQVADRRGPVEHVFG